MGVGPGPSALVADDHALFRSGFSAILRGELKFRDVLEAECLESAIAVLGSRPDIRLATLDLSMPGVEGPGSLQFVRQSFPDVLVVVLTASMSRTNILDSLAAGVHGYVPKTFGIRQIATALQRVLDGEIYVPPAITELTMMDVAPRLPDDPPPLPAAAAGLTPRQSSVLACIAEGKSNKEIARTLGLTESTVKVHVHALFRALAVHNRTSAAAVIHAGRAPGAQAKTISSPD